MITRRASWPPFYSLLWLPLLVCTVFNMEDVVCLYMVCPVHTIVNVLWIFFSIRQICFLMQINRLLSSIVNHGATTAVGIWLQQYLILSIKTHRNSSSGGTYCCTCAFFQIGFVSIFLYLKLLQRWWDFDTAGSTVVMEVLSFWWILVLCPVVTGKAVWRVGEDFATGPEHSTQLWQVHLLVIAERPRLHFLILLGNQTTLTITYVPKGVSKNYSKSKHRLKTSTVNILKQKSYFFNLLCFNVLHSSMSNFRKIQGQVPSFSCQQLQHPEGYSLPLSGL